MKFKWYLISGVLVSLFSLILLFRHSELAYITWHAFIVSSIIMALTPGANQMLSLRNGYNHGVSTSIKAVSGRFSAFVLMIIVVALGLGTLLMTSSMFFQIADCKIKLDNKKGTRGTLHMNFRPKKS